MHTALNKTLAAVPDDTKVYVSPPHSCPGIIFADFISPDMSTRRPTLNLASQFFRASQSRNYKPLQRRTRRRKESLLLVMRR
jgi:hypothetical protein